MNFSKINRTVNKSILSGNEKDTNQSYIKARPRDAASLSSFDWDSGTSHAEFSVTPI